MVSYWAVPWTGPTCQAQAVYASQGSTEEPPRQKGDDTPHTNKTSGHARFPKRWENLEQFDLVATTYMHGPARPTDQQPQRRIVGLPILLSSFPFWTDLFFPPACNFLHDGPREASVSISSIKHSQQKKKSTIKKTPHQKHPG